MVVLSLGTTLKNVKKYTPHLVSHLYLFCIISTRVGDLPMLSHGLHFRRLPTTPPFRPTASHVSRCQKQRFYKAMLQAARSMEPREIDERGNCAIQVDGGVTLTAHTLDLVLWTAVRLPPREPDHARGESRGTFMRPHMACHPLAVFADVAPPWTPDYSRGRVSLAPSG